MSIADTQSPNYTSQNSDLLDRNVNCLWTLTLQKVEFVDSFCGKFYCRKGLLPLSDNLWEGNNLLESALKTAEGAKFDGICP